MPLTGTLRFTRPTLSGTAGRMGKGAKRRTHQKVRLDPGFNSLPLTGTLRFTRPTLSGTAGRMGKGAKRRTHQKVRLKSRIKR